jgi:hypothetical protein
MKNEKELLCCLSMIDGCDISDNLIENLKSDLRLDDHQVNHLKTAKELGLKWSDQSGQHSPVSTHR